MKRTRFQAVSDRLYHTPEELQRMAEHRAMEAAFEGRDGTVLYDSREAAIAAAEAERVKRNG
jgi:hypothetical protein